MPDDVCYTAVVQIHSTDWSKPYRLRKSFPGLTLQQVQQEIDERITSSAQQAKGIFSAAAIIEIDGIEAYRWRGSHWETLGN